MTKIQHRTQPQSKVFFKGTVLTYYPIHSPHTKCGSVPLDLKVKRMKQTLSNRNEPVESSRGSLFANLFFLWMLAMLWRRPVLSTNAGWQSFMRHR